MVIRFKREAIDSFEWTLNHLTLMAADVEVSGTHYEDSDFTGIIIASVSNNGMRVWNRDHKGEPLRNSHRIIPIENIISVTIL
jgi:hypothetical protein